MRLSLSERSVFEIEYSQKWTGEIFKIHTRFRRKCVPVYTLVDWDGERVEGTFYNKELQAVNVHGFPVRLREVKLITFSTSHTLSSRLDLQALAIDRALIYEPELFPALNFKMDRVNFCCFHTGNVVITGVEMMWSIQH